MIRRLAPIVAVLIALGLTPIVRGAAASPGACNDNVGVNIVVDFQALGGGVSLACAPGSVSSGLDALDKAEVSWEWTQRYRTVVCRIAGRPGADKESCVNMPPPNAYWSYWFARRGGQWCYSSVGPASRKPPAGSVEGWSFATGGGNAPPPRYAPPPPSPGAPPEPVDGSDCATPSTATTTATTSSSATPPPPPPPPPPPAQVPSPSAPVAAAGATRAATTTTAPDATTTTPTTLAPGETTTTSSAVESASGPALNQVDLTDDGGGGGGSPIPALITVGLLGGLGATGIVLRRLRR